MSLPPSVPPLTSPPSPSLLRSAVWVAIGALIAAAIVCVVWVLVGPQNSIVARAFLTILLLAGFAGAAILDAHLSAQRPPWYVLASMVGWVVILLAGAFKIWLPMHDDGRFGWDNGFVRFIELVGVALVVRLALLHMVIFIRAAHRSITSFTRTLMIITVALVTLLAVMLLVPLTFPREFTYPEFYWRIVVAVTILATVGTALIPLINALNSPRTARSAPLAQPAWPTYVDGVTPLPVLPDGSPDWNAYYTGYPSPGAQVFAPQSQPQSQPQPQPQLPPADATEAYPPPPPLPPRPPLP